MTFPVVPTEPSHTRPQASSPSAHQAGVRAQRPTTEPPVMKPSRRPLPQWSSLKPAGPAGTGPATFSQEAHPQEHLGVVLASPGWL